MAKRTQLPKIEVIEKQMPLFYVGIYKDVVTTGHFEIIGFKQLEQTEIDSIPPSFWQNYFNYTECSIYFLDGREQKATPEECVGLEMGGAWEAEGVIERIEDYYAGRKNFNVEHQKPILSPRDIRYMPPPQALKWNFEKQEFYRTDKQ